MSELLNCPFCGKPPKPVGDGLVSCANFMCAIVAVTFTPELWNRRQPIDAATIRELLPVAKVVDNNQPGWRVVVEVAPHTTLSLGTMLYLESDVRALTQNAAATQDGDNREVPNAKGSTMSTPTTFGADSRTGAFATPAPAAAPDMVQGPREPTEEMIAAGDFRGHPSASQCRCCVRTWRAMLAAHEKENS